MKSRNSLIVVGAVIAVLVIGGFIIAGNSAKQQSSFGATQAGTTIDNRFSARFLSYSEDNLKKATQNGGRAVIFFHAKWCFLCPQAEEDLKSNFDKVPENITILKTDYDTSEQLKAKYGIVSPDTWVQVDSNGKELMKWNSGGEVFSALLANIK